MSDQIDPEMYISEYKACFGRTPIRVLGDKDYENIVSQKIQNNKKAAKQEVSDYYEKIVAQKIKAMKKSQGDFYSSSEHSSENNLAQKTISEEVIPEVTEKGESKSTSTSKVVSSAQMNKNTPDHNQDKSSQKK